MVDRQSESSSKNRIQAVENAFNIVREIQTSDGCTIKHVMESLDIPRSTAHIYLKTLEESGYLKRQEGKYHIGVRFLEQGGYARHQLDIYQRARGEVDELAKTTQSVATIGCEDDGVRVLLYRTEPAEAVSDNAPTGEYTKMHWTALGKALLSQKPDTEIEGIVECHGLPQATEHTLTEIDDLLEDLEKVRSRGYAIEDEERVNGVRSIATPIESKDDLFENVAISIAGPKPKFNSSRIKEELAPALQESANVIQLKKEHY